ncbi:hypothetical protein J6590_015451 [Homalodisca vitripennis]|nr:hypothetical protein J6590_015451 [Homalodisca vitripennis]
MARLEPVDGHRNEKVGDINNAVLSVCGHTELSNRYSPVEMKESEPIHVRELCNAAFLASLASGGETAGGAVALVMEPIPMNEKDEEDEAASVPTRVRVGLRQWDHMVQCWWW